MRKFYLRLPYNAPQNSKKLFAIIITASTLVFYLLNCLVSKEIPIPAQCGRFPEEKDIFIDNIMWQVLETPSGFVKLLNAYLDTRQNKTIVRVIANGPQMDIESHRVYCQFWFNGTAQPYVVRASGFQIMWMMYTWKIPTKLPYMIICPINFAGTLPISVSLTVNPCDFSENNLQIIDNQPENGIKKKFGVCSKQITFSDRRFVIRFIEWVHLIKILGAEKIHMYNRYVHPELFEILNHFEELGYIDVKPFLEPTSVANSKLHTWPSRTLEINMLNDCFYKVRNLYEYIAVIDPDEVIMPTRPEDRSWHDILSNFKKPRYKDSLMNFNLFFPPVDESDFSEDVPSYHYMLQHTQRSRKFSGRAFYDFKSFIIPDRVESIFNHKALSCFKNKCGEFNIPVNYSQVNHYRNKVKTRANNFTMKDDTILKFKDELIQAVAATLEATGFEP